MAPFRRRISMSMDPVIFNKLGNKPDAKKAWTLIRSSIGEELFKREFVAVPHIEAALHYNQLAVFKKQLDPYSLLRLRPPRYRIFNRLDNLLNIELSPWIPRYDFSPWCPEDSSRLFTEFKIDLVSPPHERVQKSIEVILTMLHIRSSNPPIPGSTVLKVVSSRGCVMYMITSVVYARYVKICVSVGSERDVFRYKQTVPVGFKYRKYKILANGYLDAELPTVLKFTDSEGVWLPPADDTVTDQPLWDPMRRRHDGTRPIRNILTMATSISYDNPPSRAPQY